MPDRQHRLPHPSSRDDPAVRITTAAPARGDDIAARQRRYLISMGIRTVCFVGAVLADGVLRWTLVVAAIVLPYIAVVMANAGNSRQSGLALPAAGSVGRELEDGSPPVPGTRPPRAT